jgi:hypothetical protein
MALNRTPRPGDPTRLGKPMDDVATEAMRGTKVADRAGARKAVADILTASPGVTLGGLKLRDLIDEGRP